MKRTADVDVERGCFHRSLSHDEVVHTLNCVPADVEIMHYLLLCALKIDFEVAMNLSFDVTCRVSVCTCSYLLTYCN